MDSLEGHFSVHEGKDVLFVGLIFIVALVSGMLCRVLERYLPIPYTLTCLLMGFIIGMISFHLKLGALGDSIDVLLHLHPYTIIFLFLPPLIYESSSSMDYHTYKRSAVQSLILAGPGVFLSAGLTTLVAMYVFPYHWNFVTAMTLGSILSATDPVAVVALLRELGAPRSIATIIEGESLLNDGVAFVLFVYFYELLIGEQLTVVDFFLQFIYASVVGYLLGWALGHGIVFLMGLLYDDTTTIVLLSIVGAFGTFYIADGMFQVSGVLAVVAFGLSFASRKAGNIHEHSSVALEHIWETLGFLANTLVFVYSGLIICFYIVRANVVTATDFQYLLLFYVIINLIRGVVIVALSPCLASFGYGINWKTGVLLTWGGLRGAVGLSLGLIVVTDARVDPLTGARIMFHVAGIAALTLLINGTTAGWIVRRLQLDRSSAAAKVFYFNAIENIKHRVETTLSIIRRDEYFKGADWNEVLTTLPILSKEMQCSIESRVGFHVPLKTISKSKQNLFAIHQAYKEDEHLDTSIIYDAHYRYLDIIKSGYRHEFEHASIESRPAFQILINASTAAQDHCSDSSYHGEWTEILNQIQDSKLCQYRGRRYLDWRLALRYELAAVFVKVHLQAEDEFIKLIDDDYVSGVVLASNNLIISQAQDELDEMNTTHPTITGSFKTRWATQWILNDIWTYAAELRAHGKIEDKELNMIMRELKQKRKVLVHQKFYPIDRQEKIQVLRNCELFEHLDSRIREEIIAVSVEKQFSAEEVLQCEGESISGLFVITQGMVEMSSKIKGKAVVLRQLTSGQLLGNVTFAAKSTSKWTMICKTKVECYFVPYSYVEYYLKYHQFEKNVFFNAGMTILDSYHTIETGNRFTPQQMHTIISKAELLTSFEASKKSDGIGILFSGTAENHSQQLNGVSKFEFDGTWQFVNAIIMRIPPQASWIVNTEDSYFYEEHAQFQLFVHCLESCGSTSPVYHAHRSPTSRRKRQKPISSNLLDTSELLGISEVQYRRSLASN